MTAMTRHTWRLAGPTVAGLDLGHTADERCEHCGATRLVSYPAPGRGQLVVMRGDESEYCQEPDGSRALDGAQ